MGVTIGDVARLAGVGRGTVSRVLNDRPNVDPATRARVVAAIEALDYVPSPTARRLSLGRTQTVAVVVPYLATPSVVERLRGIESTLVAAGFDMIVFNIETVERRDTVLRELPRRERVDGLIVVSIRPRPDEVRRIAAAGLPTVLLDAEHRGLPRIVVDDIAGGGLAARHVIDLGHRRIAFLGDPPRLPLGFSSSRLRLRGVRNEVALAGLELPPERVATGEHGRRVAAELTGDLLRTAKPPTAVICASDTQALGALEAAASLGFEVPGELSIMGYDDIELAEYVGLSTVHQPLRETGVRAAERLLAIIGGSREGPRREAMTVEVVARRTTAPPGS